MAVDGSANNDDNSGTAAGGQTRVALESVQEFQVITNQFDAEFGRATGAVVNSITKRGTNEFTGALFNYYTNDGMTAKDFFVARNDALPKPETSKREFGGVIGGPILQDQAHFFFSLERQLVAPGSIPRPPAARRRWATAAASRPTATGSHRARLHPRRARRATQHRGLTSALSPTIPLDRRSDACVTGNWPQL